jgi:hypothetical protein
MSSSGHRRQPKRQIQPRVQRNRLRFETLESRILLDASLPLFLYEWDVNAYEEQWFSGGDDKVWEYSSKSEGETLAIGPSRHDFIAKIYASGVYLGVADGFAEWTMSASETPTSTNLNMSYRIQKSFSSSALKPNYGSTNGFNAYVTIWTRSKESLGINGRIITSRLQHADLGATAFFGLSHSRSSGAVPIGEQVEMSFDKGQRGYPFTRSFNGATYYMVTREALLVSCSIGDTNNLWGTPQVPSTYGTEVSGLVSYELSMTASVPEIPPVPFFTSPETLGLGKTLELDASGSFDPDQAKEDGTGIAAYEWYAQRVDGQAAMEYLGSGVTLNYAYSDSSILDELGLYDITLKITDDEGSIASLTKRLSLTMDFRNFIFHGWSPLPGETLSKTQASFAGYASRLDELLGKPELVPPDSTFKSLAVGWDSFSGFSYAVASRLAAEVMLAPAPPRYKPVMLALRLILFWTYQHQHALASRKAEDAAVNAAKSIAEEPGITPNDPFRTFAIHLIGHSRGGYVASRTSQILESNYGLKPSYVTALDGYADDWPGIASSFADGSIISTATALNGNNFRVQQNLLEIVTDPIADAVAKAIQDAASRFLSPSSWLSEAILNLQVSVDEALKRWTESLEWRAPVRAGIFGNNEIIPGTAVTGPSNHINIHELYFGTPATESREAIPANVDLLLKSPVGNPSGSVPRSSSGGSGEAFFNEPLDREIDFLSPRFFGELYHIRQLASENLGILEGEEAWIDVYLHLLATPGFLEEQFFGTTDAKIVQLSNGQHGAVIAPLSGLKTLVSTPGGDGAINLSFTMENLLDGQSVEIQVTSDGEKFGSIVIDKNGSSEHSLPFSFRRSGIVNLELAVATPSYRGFSGNVLLTSVRMLSSSPRGDFHASPAFNVIGQGEEIVLRLADPISTSGEAIGGVVFYIETNNRHSLQDESPRDTMLGEAILQGDDWVLSISEADLHQGKNILYAKVTSERMRQSVQSLVLESFTRKSSFTFYSNPFDVNRDDAVNPLDALLVLNYLSRTAGQEAAPTGGLLPDVNGNGYIAPLDALLVLNEIARRSSARPENEGVSSAPTQPLVISSYERGSAGNVSDSARFDWSHREHDIALAAVSKTFQYLNEPYDLHWPKRIDLDCIDKPERKLSDQRKLIIENLIDGWIIEDALAALHDFH